MKPDEKAAWKVKLQCPTDYSKMSRSRLSRQPTDPSRRFWVRRLAIVERRSPEAEPIRVVGLHKGLNIVRCGGPAGRRNPPGRAQRRQKRF